MNVDERIEKLIERHEALAQSIELMVADGKLVDQRIDRLTERQEALAQSVELLVADGKLATARVQILAEAVSKLLNIAEIHEHRLDGLEGAT